MFFSVVVQQEYPLTTTTKKGMGWIPKENEKTKQTNKTCKIFVVVLIFFTFVIFTLLFQKNIF